MKISRIVYLFLFIVAVYFFISQANYFARLIYPFPYREVIIEEAQKYEIEPLLIAAVVWVESSFNEEAQSVKGARGLMQIMPETGFWVAEQIGLKDFTEEQLFDPSTNIMIGTWYLGDLFRQFEGNFYIALAAYNGGRGHVKRWIQEGVWDGSREGVENIPFPETRSFVLKVERTYKRYTQLYPNS